MNVVDDPELLGKLLDELNDPWGTKGITEVVGATGAGARVGIRAGAGAGALDPPPEQRPLRQDDPDGQAEQAEPCW